eukprot:8382565-Lingulodinium_polyedra.AAC.1
MLFSEIFPLYLADFEDIFPGEAAEHEPRAEAGQEFFRLAMQRLFGDFAAADPDKPTWQELPE